MTLLLLKIAAGFVLLYFGGEALVRGAEAIATRFGLSPLVIGLTVVAFGTSSPELFVSLSAAGDGHGDVAIGNAVGSNICNLALVLGLAAAIRPIQVEAQLMRFDAPILIVCCLLLILLLTDGSLAQVDGLILTTLIITYVGISLWLARRDAAVLEPEFEQSMHTATPLYLAVIYVALGLGMLIYGAELFVGASVEVARSVGISEALIGLTLVAIGTSLPELATTIVASLKGRGDIAVGNAVGSSIFNILAILGITAVVMPVDQGDIEMLDLLVMVAFAVVLVPMLFSRRSLSRTEGVLLMVGYFLWLGWVTTGK